MGLTIERIIILKQLLNNKNINKNEKYHFQKYLNNSVISVLKKRKRYLDKQIIDVDNYKRPSLSKIIKSKQYRHFHRDDIDWKIIRLMEANKYFRYYYSEYLYNKNLNLNDFSTSFIEHIKFSMELNFNAYCCNRENAYDHIIQLIIISRNIKNRRKWINEKLMQFRLRICSKLIKYYYVGRK